MKAMKTKIFTPAIIFLLLLSGIPGSFGQHFSLGAKAGAGFANYSNFDSEGLGFTRAPNIMVQGGFVVDYKFARLIGLQAELLFQQKGEAYRFDYDYNGTEHKNRSRMYMNYLTMPVLFKFWHTFGKFNLSEGLGPYIGYALNGKFVQTEPENSSSDLKFGKDKFRRFDAGVSIDLNGGISLGPGNLFLDLRYDFGLMDIAQPEDKGDNYKSHCNRNFAVNVGYIIPLRNE
jgi:hypothetical protein